MSTIKWRWALDDLPELRALIPAVFRSRTSDERADAVLDWIWRNCYETGIDDPGLTGEDRYRAMGVYRWWQANSLANGGRGPAMSCGSVGYLTVGMMASLGVPAVVLLASNANGSNDVSVQYWSNEKPGWIHVLPAFNAHFEGDTGTRLSYMEWSTMERVNKNRDCFRCVSPTGGNDYWDLKALEHYREWLGFTASAFVQAGNATLINGDTCQNVQIYTSDTPNALVGNATPTTIFDIEPSLCAL